MPEETNTQKQVNEDRIRKQDEILGEKPTQSVPPYKSPLHALRTYQGDVQEIMARNGTSLTSIAVAEQKRKEETLRPTPPPLPVQKPTPTPSVPPVQKSVIDRIPTPPPQPEVEISLEPEPEVVSKYTPVKNKVLLFAGSILLCIGVVAIGYVVYVKMISQPEIITKSDALLSYAEEYDFQVASTSRTQFISALVEKKKTFKLPVNSVLYINALSGQNKIAPSENFMTFIAPQIPSALARSFDGMYMIGVYSFDMNQPFIVLGTSDFGAAYAGMLKWEDTMIRDIGDMFEISPRTDGKGFVFEDEALKNNDLRIVKDANRKTVLVYSFIDRNTLVITANENVLTGIIGKYITNKMTR